MFMFWKLSDIKSSTLLGLTDEERQKNVRKITFAKYACHNLDSDTEYRSLTTRQGNEFIVAARKYL